MLESVRTILLLAALLCPAAAIPQDFEFFVDDATVVYDPNTGEGSFVAVFSIGEDPDGTGYPNDAAAFAAVLTNNREYAEPIDADSVGALADLNDGDGPFSWFVDIDDDAISFWSIIGIIGLPGEETLTLAGGAVVEIEFELEPDTFEGSDEEFEMYVAFVEDPVYPNGNYVYVDDSTFDPSFSDGLITIVPGCAVVPPSGLSCEFVDGSVELSWENPDAFDTIIIHRDGEEIATLEDGETYVHEGALGGYDVEYQVTAYVEDEECGTSTSCFLRVATSCNDGIDEEIPSESSVASTIEIEDSVGNNVAVLVDIQYTSIGDLEIGIESPEGTSVQLHEEDMGGDKNDIRLTYADDGVSSDTVEFTCACRVRPSGPGELSDFGGEDYDGEWTLTIEDTDSSGAGLLSSWCLSLEIGDGFLRGDCDGNGDVSALLDASFILRWAFASGDEPPCQTAADVDDDGSLSALVDAIYLLKWAFASGEAPPAPGTEECGDDPTEDELSCDEIPAGC